MYVRYLSKNTSSNETIYTVGCRDWHGVSPLPYTIFDVLREKRKLFTASAEDLSLRLRVVVTLPRQIDTIQKQIASETGEVAHGKDVRAIPHGWKRTGLIQSTPVVDRRV